MSQEVPEWKYQDETTNKRDASPVRNSPKSISQEDKGVGFRPIYAVNLSIYKSDDGARVKKKRQYYRREIWALNEISLMRRKYGFSGVWPCDDNESIEQYKCPVTKQCYDVKIRLEKSTVLL
jgi:hypothetical protein